MSPASPLKPVLAALALALAALAVGCGDDGSEAAETPDAGAEPVIELAVRRLNPDQDLAAFESARDAFVARLREQPGVGTDREIHAFFDFGSQAEPTPPGASSTRRRRPPSCSDFRPRPPT